MREPAIDRDDLGSLGAQTLCEGFVGKLGNGIAAGEEIYRSVAMLWPRVDREMRFFDNDHAGDAMWLKRLEYRCDDVGAGCLGSLVHQRFNTFQVIQYQRVAARVLNE